jgi:hypothetical protein
VKILCDHFGIYRGLVDSKLAPGVCQTLFGPNPRFDLEGNQKLQAIQVEQNWIY